MKSIGGSVPAPAYLLLCLLLGGASAAGAVANAVVQLVGLVLIGWLLLARRVTPLAGGKFLVAILGGAAILLLLQLMPLPPALWTELPGRDAVAAPFGLAGVPLPWASLSLSPEGTVGALLALIAPVAMLLATLHASRTGRRAAIAVLVLVMAASLALGVLQRLADSESALYLYRITNRGSAVGFFANRNHLATLLLCTLPFLMIPAWSFARGLGAPPLAKAALIAAAVLVVIGGVVMAGSRAGLAMLPFVVLASLAARERSGRDAAHALIRQRRWAGVAALILLVGGGAVLAMRGPVAIDGNVQHRPVLTATTLTAARAYLPLGTGGGSFTRIYPQFEDRDAASLEYANHAHNDYAEVLLDHGLPGALLVLAAWWWWAVRARASWSARGEAAALGRAGIVALGVVIVHSAVDYPARTAAIAALIGLCAALALRPGAAEDADDDRRASPRLGDSGRMLSLMPVPPR